MYFFMVLDIKKKFVLPALIKKIYKAEREKYCIALLVTTEAVLLC